MEEGDEGEKGKSKKRKSRVVIEGGTRIKGKKYN